MATVVLASALSRWLPSAQRPAGELRLSLSGERIDALLEAVFEQYPALRGYLLDEHGSVRHHVAIFIDGDALRDKHDLRQPVREDAEVWLMQALSGG